MKTTAETDKSGSRTASGYGPIWIITLTALVLVANSFGAVKAWDGSSSGNWSVGANWSDGIAPAAGDDLVFPEFGVTRYTMTNDFIASPRAFRSITFYGSNYVVWGTNLVLTNGIDAVNVSGANTIWNDVELRASQTFLSFATAADLTFNGDVALGTYGLTLNCRAGDIFMNGSISGNGSVTKTGAGVLRYSGDTANTYTGFTWVRTGTLLLNKLPAFGAMSGPLTIGEDGPVPDTDVVRLLNDQQLPNDEEITIYASGLLDLNGFDQNVGDIILNGGHIDAPSPGRLLPLGDIAANANTNAVALIEGRMSIASNPILDVASGNFSPDLRISAQLFGAGGLTKNGPGELALNASNSFTGTVTLNSGFVDVDNSFALGTTNGGTVVNAGTTLAVRFGADVPREALALAGTLSSLFGSNSWAGNITLTSNATVNVRTNDFLNLSGSITDVVSSDLTKVGPGTLIFSGGAGTANSYDDTIVNQGTLELAKTIINGSIPGDLQIGDGVGGINADVVRITSALGQIANTANVNISASGLLDINTVTETIHRIEGGGRLDLGTGTLNVDNFNEVFTFSGLIFGAGDLQFLGNPIVTLTANNTYSGTTAIGTGDGKLIVNGVQPQSPVSVGDDADLAGSGVVGHINCLGEIKPGTPDLFDPAILTCSNLFFGSSTLFHVDIGGSTPGTGYDQLNVRGTNRLSGNTNGTTGTELRVRVGGGFAPTEGQQFIILNNDGSDAIVGTFEGLPNNSVFTSLTGQRFHIRYSDTFGNDVVLTFTNPATRVVTNTISGGNGNGIVDVNECNFLNVVLTNTTGGVLSDVTGTLVSKTPGVSVTHSTSAYPVFPINARRTNALPFQFTTSPTFVCGGNIQFDLVVSTPTNGSFTLPIVIGPTSCGNGGGGCESCPERTISGFLGTNSPVQWDRLNRDGVMHVCDEVRACPGLAGEIEARYFDAYTFENGESNACITVTLTSGSDELFSAAYTNFYNPSNACQNYLTDAGTSTLGVARSYSFNTGPRARFVIVVHADLSGDGGPYTLAVTGGSCRPVLNIQRIGANQVALDWSTAAIGYGLQHTNRLPPVTNPIWTPSTPAPVIINSRFRVTNTISPSNAFYELRKP